MKYVLLLIFVFVSIISFGQNPPGYQSRIVRERIQGSFMVDSMLHIPRYCGTPSGIRGGGSIQDGAIAIDTCNSIFYMYVGGIWSTIGGVSSSRAINTGYGLTGGGDLSIDRTHIFDSATVFPQLRATIKQRFGISGEDASLGQNRYVSGHDTYNIQFDSLQYFKIKYGTKSYHEFGIGATPYYDYYYESPNGNYNTIGSAGADNSSSNWITGSQNINGNQYFQTLTGANGQRWQIGSLDQIGGSGNRWIDARSEGFITSLNGAGTSHFEQWLEQWDTTPGFIQRFTNIRETWDSTGWYMAVNRKSGLISGALYKGLHLDTLGYLFVDRLATSGSAPSTTGTTKMVITDQNGKLSFDNIPTGTTYTANLPIRITGTVVSADTSVAFSPSLTTNARLQKIVDSLNGGGSGTVTSFTFTDGNGFDGTVTNSTSTPTLSLTTTITDGYVMFSNSGAISGSSNFIWTGTSLIVTGSLKSTSTTWASAFQVNELNSISTPSSGTGFYYFDQSTSKPYAKADDGTIYDLTGGGGGTPGGSDKQAQYNSSGSFGGFAGLLLAQSGINTEIVQQNTTDIALKITLASSSTEDAFQVKSSGGTVLTSINENGYLTIPDGSSSTPGVQFSNSNNGFFSAGYGIGLKNDGQFTTFFTKGNLSGGAILLKNDNLSTGGAGIYFGHPSIFGDNEQMAINSPADGVLQLNRDEANPKALIIRAGKATANNTDEAGEDFSFEGIAGTGNSTSGGSFIFKTPDATTSGTTVQSLTTKLTIGRTGFIEINEITAPGTPSSGFGRIYAKSDGKLYWKDDAGTEYDLTASGGGIIIGTTTIASGTNTRVLYNNSGVVGERKIVTNLNTNFTDVGNVGSGEDDLMTYSIPAGQLETDGDYIEFEMTVTLAANTNNKQIKLYYNSLAYYTSGSQPQNGGTMVISGKIIRTGATSQRVNYTVQSNTMDYSDYADYNTGNATLSGAVTIKLTGEATSNNDIIQKTMTIKYVPVN